MAHTDRPGANKQSFLTRAQQLEQRPPCQVGCPNSGDVRGWLGIIAQRQKHGLSLEQAYSAAWNRLVELNPFPATIGRICPHPCESRCTRADKDGAVAINDLERFLGDWAIDQELALPHAKKEPKVAEVEAGCNACHAPLAYLANDIPPKRPAENTRANEGVSCDLCHSIVGFEGDVPFNGNYIVEPGKVKQGGREGTTGKLHEVAVNPFMKSADLCGTCHNEKDPWCLPCGPAWPCPASR